MVYTRQTAQNSATSGQPELTPATNGTPSGKKDSISKGVPSMDFQLI